MTSGDIIPVQAEKSTVSTSTGEHFTQVSADEVPMVKSTLEVATQEAITISTFETFMVTSEMRKLMVQLVPILVGGMNAPHPPYESTITAIMKTGSRSTLPMPTPITDIMEELTL